jgi:hypothetical protein
MVAPDLSPDALSEARKVAAAAEAGFVTWPAPGQPRRIGRTGWRCPDCDVRISPDVREHTCSPAPGMLYKTPGADPADALHGLSSAGSIAPDANT